MILVGDVGGTKTYLAIFDTADFDTPVVQATLFSPRYSSLEGLVSEFLSYHKKFAINAAAFGVAGYVHDGTVTTPNLPWTVRAKNLAEAIDCENVALVNDVEANAYGLELVSTEDLIDLNPEGVERDGNRAVISPGTGLGQAGIFAMGRQHMPFACEGGHTDFAPRTELESELMMYLHNKFGRVSVERVVSGMGLSNIYDFLRDAGRGTPPAEIEFGEPSAKSRLISEMAQEGKSELCSLALNMFVSLLGAEAGNLALKMMAVGGIYLGGGIPPKIITKLKEGSFLESFLNKGRMRPLLEKIPVKVIMTDRTAMLGALVVAKGLLIQHHDVELDKTPAH
ncbi:MAG: glucokinase [Cyanobacteria bacterium SZAS LIN-2]|nr:glucokinase [Cyanobacteria bacterium SZAS LIN-2]